jgi:hypothetical protein
MRVLLDENMPQAFRFELPGHDVNSVGFLGLSGLKNGELLAAMIDEHIQALITLDQNLQYQQSVAKAGIAVVVLHGKSTKLHDLLKLAPEVTRVLEFLQPGQVVQVPASAV